MRDEDAARVHEAIEASLDEGEIAIQWVLTIDIAATDDRRYLAHLAGGGHNGSDAPMAWTALGMHEASVALATEQVLNSTRQIEDEDEE